MLNIYLNFTENGDMTAASFIICFGAALVYGLIIAIMHMYHNQYTKNFIVTLVLLPAIVQTVMVLVNGNLGTGVAVMGAFSLVRFRSVPGNSREIGSLFLAMATGLAAGTGYIIVGLIVVLILGVLTLILEVSPFGDAPIQKKHLKVTIPENLDYTGIFDDIFDAYTKSAKLLRVRTVNMGSMYELQYHISLKNETDEKKMIDEIRCRNGNLTVVCGWIPAEHEEL